MIYYNTGKIDFSGDYNSYYVRAGFLLTKGEHFPCY